MSRVRRGGPSIWVAVFGLGLLCAAPAHAFKPEGHDIIEAAAYRRLMQTNRPVLRRLIEEHALLPPRCFDVKSDAEAATCDALEQKYPGVGWPSIETGRLDEFFDRQFDAVGQCFHFMARGSDVWESQGLDPKTGVPEKLSGEAYKRCENLLEALLSRVLKDPSTRADHLYALMHALTDSFSAAHTERYGQVVEYLKPWDLLTWAPYLFVHPSGLHYLDTPMAHHIVDDRDNEFISCGGVRHPYLVPEACLTTNGLAAVDAVVDLLETVDRLLSTEEAQDAEAAQAWTQLVRAHLDSPAFTPPEALSKTLGEWRPQRSLGLRMERDWGADATSISAVLQLIHSDPALLPFNATTNLELGASHLALASGGTVDAVRAGLEIPAVIPIADYFALGITPLRVVADMGPREANAGFGLLSLDYRLGVRAELMLKSGLWVAVAYPFFSWTETQFHPLDFSLVVGFVLRGPKSLGGELPLLDGSRWNPRADTDGRVPPPLGQLGLSFTNVVDQDLFVLTARFTHDIDAWMGRGGFGWAFEAGTFIQARLCVGTTSSATCTTTNSTTAAGSVDLTGGLSVGAAARYFVVPDLLALEVRPVVADWQTHSSGWPITLNDWGSDVGIVGVLSLLEVHLYSPRLIFYSRPGVDTLTPRNIQIGLTVNFVQL